MITNLIELRQKVTEASTALQEINDFVRDNPELDRYSKVRFPRGFLRTAFEHRSNLSFITDRTLKHNVSYALMTHDVLRWLTNRTDLSGQAMEMVTKEAVCLLGSVCESISIYPAHHGLGRGAGFGKRVNRLVEMRVIEEETRARLEWLWGKRNQEHLIDVMFQE